MTIRTVAVRERTTVHSMGNRRTAKVAEAIREVVSSTILLELRDPRIQNVTVLGVEVPIDLRTANIIVSIMGDDGQQRLSMSGLNAARGFLQSKIADRVNLRYTPIVSFELDDGVKKSVEASRILRELAEERAAHEVADGDSPDNDSPDNDSPDNDSPSPDNVVTNSTAADGHDLSETVSDHIDGG